MAKFRIVPESENQNQLQFRCPGCNNELHALNDKWEFNGDLNNPTISPSLLVRGWLCKKDGKDVYGICHSFIKDGKIQYLGDCDHELKNKIVELPDFE